MSHRIEKSWRDHLRSIVPFGLGARKPKHFRDMLRVVWKNRDNLGYAYKVMTKGVCDGCALGVAGLHDWTIDGVQPGDAERATIAHALRNHFPCVAKIVAVLPNDAGHVAKMFRLGLAESERYGGFQFGGKTFLNPMRHGAIRLSSVKFCK